MTLPGEGGSEAAAKIDRRIAQLADWRGETLARVRALILEAVPGVLEAWKWEKPGSPGVAVWEWPTASGSGGLCTGEVYRGAVKLTFFRGAALAQAGADPAGLFNASLDGKTRRAIDLHQGAPLDEDAFRALVRAAAEANTALRT